MKFQSTPPARAATPRPTPYQLHAERFNPRRPRGRRRCSGRACGARACFNPRRPRGRRPRWRQSSAHLRCFNPRRPRGRRRSRDWRRAHRHVFQSTPPARAATRRIRRQVRVASVSIHAARAGGDVAVMVAMAYMRRVSIHAARAGGDDDAALGQPICSFNPRRPRGRRHAERDAISAASAFQSTPPTRAATRRPSDNTVPDVVSIHAAHAGGDVSGRTGIQLSQRFNPRRPRGRRLGGMRPSRRSAVSIHAAHAGGDTTACATVAGSVPFQSTPPTRAATTRRCRYACNGVVSIHAAHAGGDARERADSGIARMFQSTPPTRAATRAGEPHRVTPSVSIHAAHAGGDAWHDAQSAMLGVSIHAAHAGGDDAARPWYAVTQCFNPRRPRGRRP